jgi:hypothetical protein
MDMLRYNAAYQVLICRECQYAIQKSAVSSHLLRHKIYRNDRQRLLSYIAGLDLLEPEHVPLPPPKSPPVNGLSTVAGYRCIQYECHCLCASLKRMKRHQTESHGVSDLSHVNAFAKPTTLQTFFKGTKLRYFEVASVSAEGVDANAPATTRFEDRNRHVRTREHDVEFTVTLPVVSGSPTTRQSSQRSFISANVDLDILAYFHHYTTVTSLTLPAIHKEPEFWQTNIVQLALEHQWLMCGLLAITACHLILSTKDLNRQRKHANHSVQFLSKFVEGYEMQETEYGLDPAHWSQPWVPAESKRIHDILRLSFWAVDGSSSVDIERVFLANKLAASMFDLDAFGQMSFSGFPQDLDIHAPEHLRLNEDEDMFSRASSILDPGTPHDFGADPIIVAMIDCLRRLPSQFFDVFGRPDNVEDVSATLQAIAALAVSCYISWQADTPEGLWLGLVWWRTTGNTHFESMLSQHSPAALVLMGCWNALVKRAKHRDMWYLRSLSRIIHDDLMYILEDEEDKKPYHLLCDLAMRLGTDK